MSSTKSVNIELYTYKGGGIKCSYFLPMMKGEHDSDAHPWQCSLHVNHLLFFDSGRQRVRAPCGTETPAVTRRGCFLGRSLGFRRALRSAGVAIQQVLSFLANIRFLSLEDLSFLLGEIWG